MGDLSVGKDAGEEALALHRELGDDWHIAQDLHMLGSIASERGDMVTLVAEGRVTAPSHDLLALLPPRGSPSTTLSDAIRIERDERL
jgi:hypothetical protein